MTNGAQLKYYWAAYTLRRVWVHSLSVLPRFLLSPIITELSHDHSSTWSHGAGKNHGFPLFQLGMFLARALLCSPFQTTLGKRNSNKDKDEFFLWSIVFKKELSRLAKLWIYHSVYIPMLAVGSAPKEQVTEISSSTVCLGFILEMGWEAQSFKRGWERTCPFTRGRPEGTTSLGWPGRDSPGRVGWIGRRDGSLCLSDSITGHMSQLRISGSWWMGEWMKGWIDKKEIKLASSTGRFS